MTDDVEAFSARLGACRRLAMLSQEELAQRSGLSVRTVRNLERGRTRWPYADSVRRLADALELSGKAREDFMLPAARRLPGAADAAVPAVVQAGAPGELVTQGAGPWGGCAPVTGFAKQGSGLAGAWLPVFQLPAAPADFTGRAAECGRLVGALIAGQDQLGVPLVVVSGPPGAGKTSLVLQVAHKVRKRFADGQLWVHLAGTSARPPDPGEVLGEFLRGLGVPGSQIPPDLAGRAACYRSWLAGRRVLVVADDAASVAQVRPLLPGTAGCAVVVTSRARLEGLDGAHLLPLDVMTAEDAVGLLARIVGTDRVAAERAAAESLAQACGGLPLALRITGAKLATRPSWPLSVMVRKLTGANTRLRELESAEVSVRASIASSYHSLPLRSRRAFVLLALLGPAAFAEWAVAALLGEPQAADVVADLESRSLLTAVGTDITGEPRFQLHDLLGDFAAERLADEPDADKSKALDRMLGAWLQLSIMANAHLPPEASFPPPPICPSPAVVPAQVAERLTADPIAWFTAERINLITGVEHAGQRGQLDLARQLAANQSTYQYLQYRPDDAERMWNVVASRARESGDSAGAVYASVRIGASLIMRGRAADALPVLDMCIEGADQGMDPEILASALEWRATCAWDLDHFTAARADAQRGVAVARQSGSRWAEIGNLDILCSSLAHVGKAEEAIATGQAALAIASGLGAPAYELESLLALAGACTVTGRHEQAVPLCQRAIEVASKLGDHCHKAIAHGKLGDAYHGLGRYDDAVRSLLWALPVFRSHRSRRFHAVCLLKLGYAYEAMGSPEATGYLEESLQIFRQLRLPRKADLAQQALNRCKRSAVSSSGVGSGLVLGGGSNA
jgi:tetratricopeptide (TPR) repeat protein/DNA-binding XRE family transcriptional regulator